MTYQQYGNIQASDFNTFATNVNTIYADSNSGATTLPTASLGYGQSPPLTTTVAIGGPVLATQWSSLFSTISKCGNHQGTAVVPPLPGTAPGYTPGSTTLPAAGNPVVAYNSPAGALTTLVSTLTANRFNLLAGQSALNTVGPFAAPSWTHTLTYTFTVNFGSWNNARYFFNSGGSINMSGTHPSGAPDDNEWATMLLLMSPLVFKYNSTTPNSGVAGSIGGFWNPGTNNPLTTSFQTIYTQVYGAVPYAGSFIQVNAKLGAAAGAAGSEVITFQIILFQADSGTIISPKSGTQFSVSEIHSAGAVIYPGPVTLTNLGFVAT